MAKSKSIDPTSKNNGGELKGVVKGQEEKALDEAIFSAKKGVLGGPGEDAVRLLHLRSHRHRSRQQASRWRSPKRRSNSSSPPPEQQTALSKFVKEFRKKWDSQNRMRQRLRGRRTATEYKKPKTTSTEGAAGASAGAPEPRARPEPRRRSRRLGRSRSLGTTGASGTTTVK